MDAGRNPSLECCKDQYLKHRELSRKRKSCLSVSTSGSQKYMYEKCCRLQKKSLNSCLGDKNKHKYFQWRVQDKWSWGIFSNIFQIFQLRRRKGMVIENTRSSTTYHSILRIVTFVTESIWGKRGLIISSKKHQIFMLRWMWWPKTSKKVKKGSQQISFFSRLKTKISLKLLNINIHLFQKTKNYSSETPL